MADDDQDPTTPVPPTEPTEAAPVAEPARRFAGRTRWWLAAGAVAVILLLVGAAGVAYVALDDHHGFGHDDRTSEQSDRSGGRQADSHHRDGDDRDANESAPASASGSATNDPNGPVVIQPSTPGGDRTVVWPDGRIVTIPGTSSVTTTTTP